VRAGEAWAVVILGMTEAMLSALLADGVYVGGGVILLVLIIVVVILLLRR
jgi:hypothetical protein